MLQDARSLHKRLDGRWILAYNAVGALSSINHLHFHLVPYFEPNLLSMVREIEDGIFEHLHGLFPAKAYARTEDAWHELQNLHS